MSEGGDETRGAVCGCSYQEGLHRDELVLRRKWAWHGRHVVEGFGEPDGNLPHRGLELIGLLTGQVHLFCGDLLDGSLVDCISHGGRQRLGASAESASAPTDQKRITSLVGIVQPEQRCGAPWALRTSYFLFRRTRTLTDIALLREGNVWLRRLSSSGTTRGRKDGYTENTSH